MLFLDGLIVPMSSLGSEWHINMQVIPTHIDHLPGELENYWHSENDDWSLIEGWALRRSDPAPEKSPFGVRFWIVSAQEYTDVYERYRKTNPELSVHDLTVALTDELTAKDTDYILTFTSDDDLESNNFESLARHVLEHVNSIEF